MTFSNVRQNCESPSLPIPQTVFLFAFSGIISPYTHHQAVEGPPFHRVSSRPIVELQPKSRSQSCESRCHKRPFSLQDTVCGLFVMLLLLKVVVLCSPCFAFSLQPFMHAFVMLSYANGPILLENILYAY